MEGRKKERKAMSTNRHTGQKGEEGEEGEEGKEGKEGERREKNGGSSRSFPSPHLLRKENIHPFET